MPKALKEPGGIAAKVEGLVRPVVEGMGLALWDVRFEKEGPGWYLKIFVDRPDGYMDTDTCEAVSRAVDPVLDEADPIAQSYYLEVGSPGLGRRLTRAAHFEAMKGEKVEAGLYKAQNGSKTVAGLLLGLEDDVVRLQGEDGGEIGIPTAEASYFKACDDEGLFD